VDAGGNPHGEAGPFARLNVLKAPTGDSSPPRRAGALLQARSYCPRYPYDWRSKKPPSFAPPSQWFASVEGFAPRRCAIAIGWKWLPTSGRNRIEAMVRDPGRLVLRQRNLGRADPPCVSYPRDNGTA